MDFGLLVPHTEERCQNFNHSALIAASLPILSEALISRRVGSMVTCDGLSEIWIPVSFGSAAVRASEEQILGSQSVDGRTYK